ncbi:MAG: L-threonine 3-dehydrogenase [Sedimentisphaerales bacterium]|nr:L-threonine 3-dehydrogenase [Sedimentisphaerales bacterium]
MKALVKKEAKEGLWMMDVPVPKIGINDVLIRVLKTAICGTDVHIYNWDQWAQKTIRPPMTIGHEFVGEIVEMGSNVHDFKAGDIVSAEGHVVCGRCRNCLAGRRHLCHSPKGIGVNRDGAFAEYISVPVTNLWYCDRSIPLDVLSCFDPLGNAVHTALTFNLVGEDVLITGAGPIGCMAAGVARKVGARHVVVTDVNPQRLERAKQMGATLTVDVRTETIAQAQEKLDMKEGFDVGMEMSGNPGALNDMLTSMAHGGKLALLGILPPTQVDWNVVIFNGLTLTGIYGRLMYETWYKVTMLIQGGLDISPLISHRFHYTEFEKGFEALRSGNGCKVVLDWSK